MSGSGNGRNTGAFARLFAPAVLVGVVGTVASAQPMSGKESAPARKVELPVTIGRVDTMYVGPRGVRPGPITTVRACNQVSSHAVASAFIQNASVNQQAGMIAGESFAATYTLTAADFPIKVGTTEVLFASTAGFPTTTRYTISFWSGNPSTGTLVASYSSDGDVLPHVVVQGGCSPQACATMLNFAVEPSDPEQIIIADNGSHTFTMAIRIDQFNTPTSCSQSPPATSNAFLCTDTNALQQGPLHWLGAVNCGGFCPAGWTQFSNLLPGLCRPTGDWVARTGWTSLSCTPGVGACCFPAGTCQVLPVADCGTQGGTYVGDGIACASANCQPQTGACCLANGTCVAAQTSSQCSSQSGVFQGVGTVCGTCPAPTGACCFSNGNCLARTSAQCGTSGGTWQGAGVACNGTLCPKGACCLASGMCLSDVTPVDCTGQGGIFRGAGTTCATQQCPQPVGACCYSNGNCGLETALDCGILGGTFAGANTSCATACSQPCYANCDTSTGSPVLTANDFQCFLDKFAGGASYANCDGSTGTPSLTANDFQCFLNKFAAGCT